jgi:hypothetical protein
MNEDPCESGSTHCFSPLPTSAKSSTEGHHIFEDSSLQPPPVLTSVTRLNISLFQAVKTGNILVIDEADKAPTNVTCILKSLAENGEMILSGRRHCAGANRF